MVIRNLYQEACALLKRKLGTCPKCMASSIMGAGTSWIAVAILYAVWPNRAALIFGLAAAAAFTALMVAHVVAHMFRAAPVVRSLPAGRRGETGRQKTRREFALAVARSGLGFAAAALMSVPLLPKRAEAGGARQYALYCLGSGCSTQGTGGLSLQCVNHGYKYGTRVSLPCGKGAPASMVCAGTGGCSLTLELVSGACGPATAPVLSLTGFKCSAA